jgi:hypothetical protein
MPSVTRNRILYSSKTAASGSPPTGPSPPIEFSEPTPPEPECDRALGAYLRAWNEVEQALAEVFMQLLGAHPTAAHIIIASGLTQQTLREITLYFPSPTPCGKYRSPPSVRSPHTSA